MNRLSIEQLAGKYDQRIFEHAFLPILRTHDEQIGAVIRQTAREVVTDAEQFVKSELEENLHAFLSK